jgi:hypothetical protein
VVRPVPSSSPSKNFDVSMPSIGRSVGTRSVRPMRLANTRRRALALDGVVIEMDPVSGQRIDVRSGGASAIHTKVSPTGVVDQDEDDVREFA